MIVSVFLPWLFGMLITSSLRRIIKSSLDCQPIPDFSTLSHKEPNFRGEGGGDLPTIIWVFWFPLQHLFGTFPPRKKNSARYHKFMKLCVRPTGCHNYDLLIIH